MREAAMIGKDEIANRFAGFSLDRRHPRPREWGGHWRARILVNKNERSHYRITTYGETPEEALQALQAAATAEEIIRNNINTDDHDRLIGEYMKEMEAAK